MNNGFSDRPLERMVVATLLAERAAASSDAPFLRFGESVVTYGELDARARRCAGAVAAAGMGPGDRVAVMMANSIDYVALYFGLAYRGATMVLVNTAYRGYLLQCVLADAGCAYAVVDADLLDRLLDVAPELPALRLLWVNGEAAAEGGDLDVVPLADALRAVPIGPDPVITYADPHCVVYSSGTTGPSKGIVISNGHAVAKAFEVLRICDFGASDVLYSPLPLFYSMGLLRGVLSVALVGASIVLRDRFSVSAYWDDVCSHGATVGHTVFSIVQLLADQPPRADDLDNPMRCMFNARWNPEFEQRFGVRLVEGYGLTEAGNAIYSRLAEEPVAGSCGRESEEWEVRLADQDGLQVDDGATGEILIRPRLPQRIMLGYLKKPEAHAAATRDLWLHTGDLATRDGTGHYFYRGRIKDMIRRRGQNISAWEVEQVLRRMPGVVDIAALAHPSELGEDDLRVVLVAGEGGLDLAEAARYCDEALPDFMVPRYLELRDELPYTPSGRVEKRKLAADGLGARVHDRGTRGRSARR